MTEDFAKLCAVILCVNEENINTACKTASFGKIWQKLFDEKPLNAKNIEVAQTQINADFKRQNSAVFKNFLDAAMTKLCEENILSEQKLRRYMEIFTISENAAIAALLNTQNGAVLDEAEAHEKNSAAFQEKLNILFKLLNEADKLIESPLYRAKLAKAKNALDNRSFSIGVTGVMNAGKSTLLNAILRADILGTAVVPETANLTILKYSKTPKAVVNFWNAKEWQSMEKSGEFLPRIANFVESTKSKFGGALGDFITEKGRSEEIRVEDLSLYTSAAKSDMKCNLVKSVELFADLAFLKDGVTIVDTPGLDDPVIRREEITKEYLSSCDLMIHLMNAAQSATAKDIDFIIDALTYQGISRLLVVITRVDAISEDELSEVIKYAKTSIKTQLERQNRGGLFQTIIEKIEFIPTAAKIALMYRANHAKEAQKSGYSEEKSGILAVENYLNNILFGRSGQKANLLINSNAKILYLAAAKSLDAYKKESENLSKSAEDLKSDLGNLQSKNTQMEAKIESLLLAVKNSAKELEEFAKTLLLEMDARANSLHAKIFSRIYDDVKYEFEKNRKKPSNERIAYILQSGLKDGILDLTRDYRFGFAKQAVLAQEKLLSRFSDLKLEAESFDVKTFFALNAAGVKQNFEELCARVLAALKRCSKNRLDEFAQSLQNAMKDEFINIKRELNGTLLNLNGTLLDEFQAKNEEPLKVLLSFMKEEIENLNSQITLVNLHAAKAKERKTLLLERRAKLENIMKITAGLHGSV
ncbi:MAG: dynamin family protein [Campylobacteraceae bacterium]|jgi:GTP-binding protein EngB required for normal cell division|nr:dynamin family protein [Campylobacteraceae bacterium]